MKPFVIDDRISFLGTCILLKHEHKTYLLFGDVHIGYEEALNKQGILIPRTMTKLIMKELKDVLWASKPDAVIITGDLKHEFGSISKQEWRETLAFLDTIAKTVPEIIIIKGNHDTVLDPILKKRGITIVDHKMLGDCYITHGNKLPSETDTDFKAAKTIIIGHEHPAVSVTDGHKHERFKAFLVCSYKRKRLIVHPSFHPTAGTDVTKERLLSPFLKQNSSFSKSDVYITADEIYFFGKLKHLKKH